MFDLSKIVEFLTFILPGFITLEIYFTFYPARKRESFDKIAWSLFASVIIYFITYLLISIFILITNLLAQKLTFIPRITYNNEWIIPKKSLILLIISIMSGFILFGFRSLRVFMGNKYKSWKNFLPKPSSAWNKLYSENEKNYISIVYLDDGSIYSGFITSFIIDPNKNDYDFILTNALRLKENWDILYKIKGLQVYLNTKNVKRIEYIDETFKNSDNTKTKQKRKQKTSIK